jgi:hypothetical protein
MDTRGSSLTKNLQGCEAHPSSPSSAETKHDCSYISIPQYAFMLAQENSATILKWIQ